MSDPGGGGGVGDHRPRGRRERPALGAVRGHHRRAAGHRFRGRRRRRKRAGRQRRAARGGDRRPARRALDRRPADEVSDEEIDIILADRVEPQLPTASGARPSPAPRRDVERAGRRRGPGRRAGAGRDARSDADSGGPNFLWVLLAVAAIGVGGWIFSPLAGRTGGRGGRPGARAAAARAVATCEHPADRDR